MGVNMGADTTGAAASSWTAGLRLIAGWSATVATFLLLFFLWIAGASVSRAATETYTYDTAGRLVTVDHGDGKTTTYTLDPAGNRTNLSTQLAGSPGSLNIVTASATYPESQGAVPVTLRRSGGVAGTVSVTVALGFNGSANSSDANLSASSVTWANGDSADKTVTVNIVNDTTLEPTETFTLAISAPTGNAGLGSPSSITFTITDDDATETTPPTAPTSLAGSSPSGSQINLTWTAATDASGISQYRVERCQGVSCSSFAQIGTSTSAAYNDSGLIEATSYSYRVKAVDGVGNIGPYSNTASISTRDVTGPTAPSNFTATAVTSSRVDLSWSASTDNVGVAGYRIERCTVPSCSSYSALASTASNVLTYSDTSPAQVTTYQYRVYAVDAVPNSGAYSTVATVTTPDGTAPTAPTGLAASVISANEIDLSWSAASDNVGVTGYKIYRNGSAVAIVSSTSYADNVLQPQTTYTYQVSALDAANNESSLSSSAQGTTPQIPDTTPPTTPSGLTATGVSSNRVDLSWGASTDTGGSGLVGYKIYRDGSLLTTVPANASPPTYSDLTTSGYTTYSYVVYAYDGVSNTSAASNTASLKTPDSFAPSIPTGLTATALSSSSVNLNWTPSTDTGGSGLVGYLVYRNGTLISSAAVGSSWPDNTALAGTTYTYTLAARDFAGNVSSQSTGATVTTPTALSASVSSVNWNWRRTMGGTPTINPPVTVTATGGTGSGYTYSWEWVVMTGDDTTIAVASPSAATTSFTKSGIPTNPSQTIVYKGHFQCKVTDSSGASTYAPTVAVTFTEISTN
jgi:YD repeat-containing protein